MTSAVRFTFTSLSVPSGIDINTLDGKACGVGFSLDVGILQNAAILRSQSRMLLYWVMIVTENYKQTRASSPPNLVASILLKLDAIINTRAQPVLLPLIASETSSICAALASWAFCPLSSTLSISFRAMTTVSA